jgi:hypothetical protein
MALVEVREQVILIPFDKVALYKISALIWETLLEYNTHQATQVGDKEEMWVHGLYIVKDSKGLVKVYSTSGKRYIQVKDICLLCYFFERIHDMSDFPVAIIPVNLWKKKHSKP